MNSKIQEMIDEKVKKVMAEYDEKFTTYKIKVKARKDGKMENGEVFCYKDEIYDAEFAFERRRSQFFLEVWFGGAVKRAENKGSEEDWYDVEDETYERDRGMKYNCPHGMDAEFFNEYFIVVS